MGREKEHNLDYLREAFRRFQEEHEIGYYRPLLQYLSDCWRADLEDRLSKRMSQKRSGKNDKPLTKREKLTLVRKWAKDASREAGAEVLILTLRGEIKDLHELRQQFGVLLGYWLLSGEIRGLFP